MPIVFGAVIHIVRVMFTAVSAFQGHWNFLFGKVPFFSHYQDGMEPLPSQRGQIFPSFLPVPRQSGHVFSRSGPRSGPLSTLAMDFSFSKTERRTVMLDEEPVSPLSIFLRKHPMIPGASAHARARCTSGRYFSLLNPIHKPSAGLPGQRTRTA